MLQWINMLSMLANDCLTFIYHHTKKFMLITNVLPLIEIQYCIQILTIYHTFLRDIYNQNKSNTQQKKTDSRLRFGCTEQRYITTAMIKFITKYSIQLTISCWIYLRCTESIWKDCKWQKWDLSTIQSFITVLVLFTISVISA